MAMYKPVRKHQLAIPMPLQFPNARLLIHDLLAQDGLTGPEAILRSACQYGLITSECAQIIQREELDGCRCMSTARKVLFEYFEDKRQQPGFPPVDVNEVWSAVERSTEAYKRASNRFPPECDPSQHPAKQPHPCSKLAPALFDYLLQQFRQYS